MKKGKNTMFFRKSVKVVIAAIYFFALSSCCLYAAQKGQEGYKKKIEKQKKKSDALNNIFFVNDGQKHLCPIKHLDVSPSMVNYDGKKVMEIICSCSNCNETLLRKYYFLRVLDSFDHTKVADNFINYLFDHYINEESDNEH